MFEIAGILTLFFVGAVVCCVLALIGFALQLVFKIALLPLTLLGFLFKALLVTLAVVLGLFVAPVVMLAFGTVLAVLAVPLLILAGLVGAGVALAT